MLVLYWKRDVVLDLDGKCVDCKSETDKKSEVRWDTRTGGKNRGDKFYILSVIYYIIIIIHY